MTVAPGPALPATARGRWFVVVVLLLAFVLRAGAVYANHDTYAPVTDALNFDLIATSIAHGDGYGPTYIPPAEGPSAFRAPLYPTTLAAVYAVAGDHSFTAGRLANQLLATVDVALIGLVASLLLGRRVGAFALVLAAIYPTLWLYGTSLQLEPLLVALELGAIAAALQHRRAPVGLRWPLVCGVCIGLAALTREVGFLLLVPVLLLLLPARPWSSATLLPLGTTVVAAAVLVLPWTARNAITFDAFVPVSTSTGYALVGTYNDASQHRDVEPALWVDPKSVPELASVMLALDHPDEAELDAALRHEALSYMADHPGSIPKSMFWNTVRLFDLQGPGHARSLAPYFPYQVGLVQAAVVSSYAMGVLALVGVARRRLRGVPLAVWSFPVLVYVNLAIVSGNIRYRASIEPFVVLAAAAALAGILAPDGRLRRAVGRLDGRRPVGIAVVALLVLGGTEGASRLLDDRLPEPLEWHSYEAQRKVEQMDGLRGAGIDVVVVGNSLSNGIDPATLDAVRPDLHAYNAGLAAGIPRLMEPWLLDVVLPRLHPQLVVLAVSSVDLAVDSPARRTFFDAYVASAGARAAAGTESVIEALDRRAGELSTFWDDRFALRDPGTLLDALEGTPPMVPPELAFLGPDGRSHYVETQRFEQRNPNFNPAVQDWAPGTDDADAIRRIAAGVRAAGAELVLVSMPITDEYVALHPHGEADFAEYVSALEALGAELDVPVLEHHDLRDHAWFADTAHLNVYGARAFTTLLAPELPELPS